MESPRGRGDPDTSATGRDCGRNTRRGGDRSVSAGKRHREDRRIIGYEGIRPKGLEKGGNKGKRPRTKTVGQNGECEEDGVLRRVYVTIVALSVRAVTRLTERSNK